MHLNKEKSSLQEFSFTVIEESEGTAAVKMLKCPYEDCEKTFRFNSEYKRHIAIHENQRPFQCPYEGCNKGFKRADILSTHVRKHTGEKPYECPVGSCKQSFSTKAGLRYHVLKHKNDKMFVCDFPKCGQSFLTLTQLRQHKRRLRVHKNLPSGPITLQYNNEQQQSPKKKIEQTRATGLYQGLLKLGATNVKEAAIRSTKRGHLASPTREFS